MKLKKREYRFCYMCMQFMDAPIRSGARICRASKKEILPDHPACDHFEISKIFYCNKRNQWQDIKACFHIRKTKKEGCGTKTHSPKNYDNIYQSCTINCKQGQQVEFLLEQSGVEFVPYVKPVPKKKSKLHKRKKLNRRVK